MTNATTPTAGTLGQMLDRRWLQLTLLAWVVIAAWFVFDRWGAIRWFALGDTDDNMRMMQVRALLDGQGWYDLRNYRLNPPAGFDIHWTRLVDLPIAGLILFLRPFAGPVWAERLAAGIAPLLPMSIAMIGVGATLRRLISPLAWPLGIVLLLGCSVTLLMFMPERIDHHGWQLAFLSLTVAGLADPKGARGGAIVGLSSAASLTIGLEMLPYAAMAGAILALRWVQTRDEAQRLSVYGLTLAGGSALGFAAFGSYGNRVLRCDALTPVWLTVMIVAGTFLFLLARLNPERRIVRLGAAVVAGILIGVGFALVFPQCLGRPEQVSPELAKNWLNNVREAKPIYKHPLRTGLSIATLPVVGMLGAIFATWRARGTARFNGWLPVALFLSFGTLMLLWQVRAGPAAQLLAIPGAAALIWLLVPMTMGHKSILVRVFGTVGAFLIASGLVTGLLLQAFPEIAKPKPWVSRVNRATGRCVTMPAMAPLNRYPAQTIFSFIDLGPRLVTLTHHDAVAGPYHRNGDAILDVQHAFGRSPQEARAIMKRHGATLLLLCPNMAESTNYRARNPGGFYDQMARGAAFDWLTPLPLPKGSPLRLYRIS